MTIAIVLAIIAHILRVLYLIDKGRMNSISGCLLILFMVVVLILGGFVAILSVL